MQLLGCNTKLIRDRIIADANTIQKIFLLALFLGCRHFSILIMEIMHDVLCFGLYPKITIWENSIDLNRMKKYEWTDDEFLPRYSKRNLFAGSHSLSTLHDLLLRDDKSMTNTIHLMFEINAEPWIEHIIILSVMHLHHFTHVLHFISICNKCRTTMYNNINVDLFSP